MHQALGDVVAVSFGLLAGMGRTESVPGLVIDQAGEEAWGRAVGRRFPHCGVVVQPCLNSPEGLAVDDGLVPTSVPYALMDDLSDVDRIGQQLVEVATGEGL